MTGVARCVGFTRAHQLLFVGGLRSACFACAKSCAVVLAGVATELRDDPGLFLGAEGHSEKFLKVVIFRASWKAASSTR